MAALVRHSWPGNVRELQNFIERSVILSTGPVLNGSLPEVYLHIEVIRACDAGRGGAFAHPSDSPADGGCGRRSEWCCRPPGPAADDVDLQDEAAGYQSRAKLSVTGANSPNSSCPSAECNYSRGCKFGKLQSAL